MLMDVDFGDTESFCNGTGMLGSGTSKDVENVIFRVESTALGQRANWTTHCLIGNFNEAKSHIVDRLVVLSAFLVDQVR